MVFKDNILIGSDKYFKKIIYKRAKVYTPRLSRQIHVVKSNNPLAKLQSNILSEIFAILSSNFGCIQLSIY